MHAAGFREVAILPGEEDLMERLIYVGKIIELKDAIDDRGFAGQSTKIVTRDTGQHDVSVFSRPNFNAITSPRHHKFAFTAHPISTIRDIKQK